MVILIPDTWTVGSLKSGYVNGNLHDDCFSYVNARQLAGIPDIPTAGKCILNPDYYPNDKFVIITKNISAENIYIQPAKLNGENCEKCFFRHYDFQYDGKLELFMGPSSNKTEVKYRLAKNKYSNHSFKSI
jgi:hypothetical protein